MLGMNHPAHLLVRDTPIMSASLITSVLGNLKLLLGLGENYTRLMDSQKLCLLRHIIRTLELVQLQCLRIKCLELQLLLV